ncbi:MAG: OmpH family outer membrane protein [Gammaproteobacteria bacterium]|jgi:outer membrane protein|nr:OmpH family outer membrane protein [Gammaproteobacteria bacterium]
MKKLTLAMMGALAMGLATTTFAANTAAAAPANTAPVAAAVTASPKIGVIELGQVLKADPQMQALKKQLEAQFKPRMDKMTALQASLKADSDKMSRNASVMSAADKSALSDKISREQRDLARMQQDYFQDAKTAQNEAMSKVLKRVDAVVAKVAQQQNLDLIFQRENVAYHSARVDITQAVIAQMKTAS